MLVFSFGSNSTAQLRARVENPKLQSQPARLDGFVRCFCYNSRGWGGGGVATLAPTTVPNSTVFGAAVSLSPEEIERLDAFEDPAAFTALPFSARMRAETLPSRRCCGWCR